MAQGTGSVHGPGHGERAWPRARGACMAQDTGSVESLTAKQLRPIARGSCATIIGRHRFAETVSLSPPFLMGPV